MTEKQLLNLKQLIKTTRTPGCGLTAEEIDDLEFAVDRQIDLQRLYDFKLYLDNSLPDEDMSPAAHDEAWTQFYDLEWFIQLGDQAIRIYNDATVYNGILSTLKDVIDNY